MLDATLPHLTRAADRSRLWIAVGVVLGSIPSRRTRRAARRGLLSLAASSVAVNFAAKRLHRRDRPALDSVPVQRLAKRIPLSSSFPSGHSASAFAFATGVAIDDVPVGAGLGVLAAGVAYSRVHTGAHYPSDVLVGAALGTAIGAAGGWLFPRVPDPEPPAPADRVDLAAHRSGRGVRIVANPRSGPPNSDLGLAGRVRRTLPEATLITLRDGDDLLEVLRAEAGRAEVLGVMGGDGTVNAAAAVAIEHDLPLLVLPGGTLNHFARDLGLDDVQEALDAMAAGTATKVDVGEVAGQLFLNTASLGSYPTFVSIREKWQDRVGKPLAALVASYKLMNTDRALPATVDGHRRDIAALFVGCGRYEPAGALPSRRARLDSGVLDVRFLDMGGRSWRVLTVLQLLLRRNDRAGALVRSTEPVLALHVQHDTLLARDGEIGPVAGPEVEFRLRPRALTVVRAWRE